YPGWRSRSATVHLTAGLAGEEGAGVLGHLADDTLPRLAATPGAVGGDDQARYVRRQQGVVAGRWLAGQHIGGGTAQMATAQGAGQGLLVHQPAACGVDEECRGFHQLQLARADERSE